MQKRLQRMGWVLSWAEEEVTRPRRKDGSLGPSLPARTWLPSIHITWWAQTQAFISLPQDPWQPLLCPCPPTFIPPAPWLQGGTPPTQHSPATSLAELLLCEPLHPRERCWRRCMRPRVHLLYLLCSQGRDGVCDNASRAFSPAWCVPRSQLYCEWGWVGGPVHGGLQLACLSALFWLEVCCSCCFTWFLTATLVGLSATTVSNLLLLTFSTFTYWNISASLQWFGLVLNRCFGFTY